MVYKGLLFAIGYAVGTILAPRFIYPLFYSAPRALVDAFRGRSAWWAPIVDISVPVLGFAALVLCGYLLAVVGIAAPVLKQMRSTPFNLGQWLGIGLVVARMLTPTGRQKLNADYVNSPGRRSD